MNWSDEILMAFADGELDNPQRAEIERALADDASLRQRVAAMKAQRERLAAAYAPVLDEPVPDRLASLLRAQPPAPATASVTNLDEVRSAVQAQRQRLRSWAQRKRGPSWSHWGGMAASVLVGVFLGLQWNTLSTDTATDAVIGLHEGRLVAGGLVAQALSSQLASEAAAGAPVAVQLSFVDQGGSYCRTFSTAAVAGLACRQRGQWMLQNLAATEAAPAGAVRQAASELPRAVLDAVDRRIAGDALDANRERQARERGWQR